MGKKIKIKLTKLFFNARDIVVLSIQIYERIISLSEDEILLDLAKKLKIKINEIKK